MFIRRLTADDLPFALRLCRQNHWNQLESDWQRQLDLEPAGCFLAFDDGERVGTACCCVFGSVAWVNLVLVEESQRGHGFGTALMNHVLQHLDDRGVASVRLDATPLGQPVYEKLGFTAEFTLARYAGAFPARLTEVPGVEPLTPDDLPAAIALDEAVTQTQREKLLRHLYAADPARMRMYVNDGRLEGCSFCRPGHNAWQLGPIQGSLAAGTQLFLDAARRFAGQRVYLDVPIEHAKAVALAAAMGLSEQRRLLRMGRGPRVREDLSRFWSGFGPEKG